ncbi:MAG: DUF1616 domain-containing protein [Nitrososphaeria archaeon]
MSWVLDEEVLAVITAIIVVASVFAIVQAVNVGRVVEPFSELGLLGSNKMIGDYPKDVVAGSVFILHLYIGNHEGKTVFYKVLVKAGTNRSFINETTPLSEEPFMEVYKVLPHNSSSIIPLNVTLYSQANNLRLVFEMWVYNEASQNFVYYGRWNQLWLNVTNPAVGAPQPQLPTKMPSYIESTLIEALLSIRRAEDAGGNVTEVVAMLDQAVEHAQGGDYERAEKLARQVLSLEPTITQTGLERKNTQFIYMVSASGVVVAIGLGSSLYLRRRIWLLWSRFYEGWKVTLAKDEGLDSNAFGKKVRALLSKNNKVTVNNIILLGDKLEYEKWSVARELFKLVKSKALKLEDLNPPTTFPSYLFSKQNLAFPMTITLLAATILTIYTPQTTIITYTRYVLGSLLVLFLPGYSLIQALYPKESDLSPLERLALSIGLSLALVPLVGLVLNYTPWGIRLDPIVFSLSILTLCLILLASYRKYGFFKLAVVSSSA